MAKHISTVYCIFFYCNLTIWGRGGGVCNPRNPRPLDPLLCRMTHHSVLGLSLILCSLSQAVSNVYYITANSIDLCTMQPCLTFTQFAADWNHYLHSNTTLVFLPGTHYLRTVNLVLSNIDNFVMKSENLTAQIKCTNDPQYGSYIHFS